MKPVKVSALVPGMVIGKDLYHSSGRLMLNEGCLLTAELITKLEYWGFTEVITEETPLSLREQQDALVTPQIQAAHIRVVNMAEELMSSPERKEGDLLLFKSIINDLDSQISLNSNVLLNLSFLDTHHNYLFTHATNVSIIAMIIGRELRLDKAVLKNLGLAALLHDYGMIKINPQIYGQTRELTPDEWGELKRHPEYGYELLAASKDFSEDILNGVRQHHERIDGSGYPWNLQGEQISLFGRIIAVADVYDACVSPRKHRRRMTPYESLKCLLSDSKVFDVKVLKALISSMAIYPIGSFVRLNTGEIAKVVGINHGFPFRPEIRIYFDRNKNRLEKPIRINLSHEEYTQTYIQETLNGQETEAMYQILGDQA
ncbi:MAG: HD-GYP domain-containing protein [Firmicutes bacterium]|nr:HD-GYP domain-containing protein [Bacillota bacterium]